MILSINGKRQCTHAPTDPLTRAVIISIFSWRRADTDDDAEHPQGWWGDTYPSVQNDRIGSRLYLLQRQKLTSKTIELVRGYITQSLDWMVDDGVIARLEVDIQRIGAESITASITLYRSNNTNQVIRFDDLWSALNEQRI